MGGAAFVALFAFPLYWLIATEMAILIRIAIVLAIVVLVLAVKRWPTNDDRLLVVLT